MRRGSLLIVAAVLIAAGGVVAAQAPSSDRRASDVAVAIDRFAAAHWETEGVTPTELSDDATFLRRATLDLVGRIPTYQEAVTFDQHYSPDKRSRAVATLMQSPEFALHWGNVLDGLIQEKYAGGKQFVAYLRRSVARGKGWDQIFRELMVGPWDSDEVKPADQFLSQRVRSLDDLTNDTARIFFGVEISCAKCHDHPLVADWQQDHFYGMASFFNRTYIDKSSKRIAEKDDGLVSFVDVEGERHEAKLMFLSGRVFDEPAAGAERKKQRAKSKKEGGDLPPQFSRREQLVKAGLEDGRFFSRAIVNRVWDYLLGRGLVYPVEQMHSENPPSIDGLLDWLADDFSTHGYDVNRLIRGIVSSRTYQLASIWRSSDDAPREKHFAVAQLRPLSQKQFGMSLLLATGSNSLDAGDAAARSQHYEKLEQSSAGLAAMLDRRRSDFQSSTREALFMSNNPEVQRLVLAADDNLTGRLAAMDDTEAAVEAAYWTVLSRAPDDEERNHLVDWIESRTNQRAEAMADVVWALLTSAEFRFNH